MEEAQLAAEDKFSNRQEEADQKTKKLKKLWKKFQEVRRFTVLHACVCSHACAYSTCASTYVCAIDGAKGFVSLSLCV